jgi:hypothetical protein
VDFSRPEGYNVKRRPAVSSSKERGALPLFNPNDPYLFVLVSFVIVFILAQSVYFLVKAWRRAKELGFSTATLKKTVLSSATFTIAPAISILLGVITLSNFLGLPLPWLRLSVIGALTYELPAATSAASALGVSIATTVTDPTVYAAIAWVMTLGIIPGLVLVPLCMKKIQRGLVRLKSKDEKWGDIFMSALFLGMISAFLGMIFGNIGQGIQGWIPVFVMLISAGLMCLCGLLVKKWAWLRDFALPICMLASMALSIPLTFALV